MIYYLTGKQAQCIDRYTQDVIGIPGIVLMEKAAEKLACFVESKIKDAGRDKILCIVESGNNGGDAVACARILKCRGYRTAVYEIGAIPSKSESYQKQIEIARNTGVEFVEGKGEKPSAADFAAVFSGYDIIVDGIFGIGLSREVKGIHKEVIEGINLVSPERYIVGCDIPSGICAGNGKKLGAAVKCHATVTFGYTKLGMLFAEGRYYCGEIICEDIGLYHVKSENEIREIERKCSETSEGPVYGEFEAKDVKEVLPERKADSNKGTYGKVLIVAGSEDVYGALYLSATACYKAGAGLVKVVTHENNRNILMDKIPEAMMLTYCSKDAEKTRNASDGNFWEKYRQAAEWADVILIGPGLGCTEFSAQLLEGVTEYVKEGQKVVLDADALNLLSEGETKERLMKFTEKPGPDSVVITPHMAEAARLLKISVDEIKENRVAAAGRLSDEGRVICVLKDARTIVTKPGDTKDRFVYVNTTGNSGMSKGGSGDVLAGLTAGLLARNKACVKNDYELVCAAVNMHGLAGDAAREKLGEEQMLPGDMLAFV